MINYINYNPVCSMVKSHFKKNIIEIIHPHGISTATDVTVAPLSRTVRCTVRCTVLLPSVNQGTLGVVGTLGIAEIDLAGRHKGS